MKLVKQQLDIFPPQKLSNRNDSANVPEQEFASSCTVCNSFSVGQTGCTLEETHEKRIHFFKRNKTDSNFTNDILKSNDAYFK